MERIFRCSRQMAWRFCVAPLPTSMWDIHGRSRQGSELDYTLPEPMGCGLSMGFGAAWSLAVRQLRHKHAPAPRLGTGIRFGNSAHQQPAFGLQVKGVPQFGQRVCILGGYILPVPMSASWAAGLSASRKAAMAESSLPCAERMKSMASRDRKST